MGRLGDGGMKGWGCWRGCGDVDMISICFGMCFRHDLGMILTWFDHISAMFQYI